MGLSFDHFLFKVGIRLQTILQGIMLLNPTVLRLSQNCLIELNTAIVFLRIWMHVSRRLNHFLHAGIAVAYRPQPESAGVISHQGARWLCMVCLQFPVSLSAFALL